MTPRPPAGTSVICQTRRYEVSAVKVRAMADLVRSRLGMDDHELSIRLVGSRTIRRLNREFRHIDKATDVLSFPQIDWAAPKPLLSGRGGPRAAAARPTTIGHEVLGDLVISLPDAEANAARIGQPLTRELGFLLVHGLLHLCGYDHLQPAEERQMRQAQRVLMRLLSGPEGRRPLWHGSVKARRPERPRRTDAH